MLICYIDKKGNQIANYKKMKLKKNENGWKVDIRWNYSSFELLWRYSAIFPSVLWPNLCEQREERKPWERETEIERTVNKERESKLILRVNCRGRNGGDITCQHGAAAEPTILRVFYWVRECAESDGDGDHTHTYIHTCIHYITYIHTWYIHRYLFIR